jgi:hypothetical protein
VNTVSHHPRFIKAIHPTRVLPLPPLRVLTIPAPPTIIFPRRSRPTTTPRVTSSLRRRRRARGSRTRPPTGAPTTTTPCRARRHGSGRPSSMSPQRLASPLRAHPTPRARRASRPRCRWRTRRPSFRRPRYQTMMIEPRHLSPHLLAGPNSSLTSPGLTSSLTIPGPRPWPVFGRWRR